MQYKITGFTFLSLSDIAKIHSHYAQSIVFPMWLHSQGLNTTCTLTNKKKKCATGCSQPWPFSAHFIFKVPVGAYTLVVPLIASFKQIPSRLSCLRGATESCKGCQTEAAASMINIVFLVPSSLSSSLTPNS